MREFDDHRLNAPSACYLGEHPCSRRDQPRLRSSVNRQCGGEPGMEQHEIQLCRYENGKTCRCGRIAQRPDSIRGHIRHRDCFAEGVEALPGIADSGADLVDVGYDQTDELLVRDHAELAEKDNVVNSSLQRSRGSRDGGTRDACGGGEVHDHPLNIQTGRSNRFIRHFCHRRPLNVLRNIGSIRGSVRNPNPNPNLDPDPDPDPDPNPDPNNPQSPPTPHDQHPEIRARPCATSTLSPTPDSDQFPKTRKPMKAVI